MVLRAVHREACKERSVFYGTRRLPYYVAASRSYSQQHPRTADRRFYTDDFPSHVYRESQRGSPYVSVISVLAS
jgi:hypothetical protein